MAPYFCQIGHSAQNQPWSFTKARIWSRWTNIKWVSVGASPFQNETLYLQTYKSTQQSRRRSTYIRTSILNFILFMLNHDNTYRLAWSPWWTLLSWLIHPDNGHSLTIQERSQCSKKSQTKRGTHMKTQKTADIGASFRCDSSLSEPPSESNRDPQVGLPDEAPLKQRKIWLSAVAGGNMNSLTYSKNPPSV